MARRRLTVIEWLNSIGDASDKIDTTVRYGATVVCSGQSPQWLASHGPVGPLEARVQFVTITRDEIIIQAKPKDTRI